MTVLVKTIVASIVLFAVAVLITTVVGRFVFTQFGAMTIPADLKPGDWRWVASPSEVWGD